MTQVLKPTHTADDGPESSVVNPGDEASQPESAEAVTKKKPRRFRRWLLRIALAGCVLLVVGGIFLKVSLDRVEARAEKVSEVGTTLNTFFKEYVTALSANDFPALLALHDEDYHSETEGMWQRELQSDRDGVKIYQLHTIPTAAFTKADIQSQAEACLQDIGNMEEAKFKISSLEKINRDDSVVIRAVLWLRGRNANSQTIETRATFRIHLAKQDSRWRISDKELLHGQTVVGAGKGFTDITSQAGITFESHHNPMLEELEWMPKTFGIMKYASAGVSTADYDGDGWYDIFFCDGATPCLYRNRGDGTFEDVTSRSGLPVGLKGVQVAIFADLDNDDDLELFLGRSTGQNFLFRNNGNGTFMDVSATANVSGVWVSTAAAADFNNDGLLDLHLGRYLDPRTALPTTNFYTRNGEGNSLLKNNGDLTFTDVTEQAGVHETGLTLGVSWADYDLDGDQDVYIANDFGRNALLRNNGDGTFTDVAKETGTVDIGYGMSACFEDVDNDGDLDLYVAAVHSGQRWFGNSATLQRYLITSIKEGTIYEDFPLYKEIYSLVDGDWNNFGEQVIRGNSLMLNNGDGTFRDVSEECQINPHGWYWSSAIFDFDNDSRQDIYTVNGWVTGKVKDDL